MSPIRPIRPLAFAALGCVLALAATPSLAAPVGTAFTYQGVLENPPGQLVNDTCAFEFALCDDASAACAPGTVSTHAAIDVTFGVFTVPDVDFGEGAITGEARWMQINVKCSGDAAFTTLSPRVELKPAPYAMALPGLYTVQPIGGPANIIGGFSGNTVGDGSFGVTIAGGGFVGQPNEALASWSTIAGGTANSIAIFGIGGAVGGGTSNSVTGNNGTVPGGSLNVAGGESSFAAGERARALHQGTFVWSDASGVDFASTGSNQFLIRANGGVGIGTNAPAQKLDVAGTIASTGLSISSGTVALPAGQIDAAEVSFNYAGSASKGGAASDVACAGCIILGSETSGAFDSTADSIADDGQISSAEVSFNYAGSTSKGGAASDLACSGCVALGTETSGSFDSTPDTIADDGVISNSEVSDSISIDNGLLYALAGGVNVGIGTTGPTQKLHVAGHINTGAYGAVEGLHYQTAGGTNSVKRPILIQCGEKTATGLGGAAGVHYTIAGTGSGTPPITFPVPFDELLSIQLTVDRGWYFPQYFAPTNTGFDLGVASVLSTSDTDVVIKWCAIGVKN